MLISLAIMGSPGPTTVSLVGVTAAFGPRRAVPYMVGEITGTTAVLLAVATGITAMLLAVPAISTVLFGASSAYIVWLAYHIATASPLAAPDEEAVPPSFGGGLLLGVANPKAWVAIAAVFANSRLSEVPHVDAALKVTVLSAMVVIIHVAWLVAGASIAPLLRRPSSARVVNIGMAVALVVATALTMAP